MKQLLPQDKSPKKEKRKHFLKKEKRKEKDFKENFKEKSLLGQKLKMAKIFGTSSEDECTSRNSKPPTPNTSGDKTLGAPQVPIKSEKLSVDQVASDSEPEKQLGITPNMKTPKDSILADTSIQK